MSTILNLLSTAQTSLTAHSAGITVAGENITGANAPGYSRRATIGGGHVEGVRRSYDAFAFRSLVTEQAHWGAAESRTRALRRAEAILHPGDGAGLDDRTAKFWLAWDQLALKADDFTARQNVVQAGQDLASTVSAMAHQLESVRDDLHREAETVVDEVNVRLVKIDDLNQKITKAPQDTSGRSALEDERDRLVREVAERISVNAIPQSNGALTLLSCGVGLVDAGSVTKFQLSRKELAPGDPRYVLKFEAVTGGTVREITNNVVGGRLGGIREARDTDLSELAQDLDQFMFDFADTVNQVHRTGTDLNGKTFANSAGALPPDLFVALGGAIGPPPGTAKTIAFNPQIDFDLSTLAAASATNPPPGGNDTALQISQLQTKNLTVSGTPAQILAQFAAKTGNKVATAQSELTLRDNTKAHAEELREIAVGVSLDEEMVNLTKFQRAFQASMRVLQAADQLLQELVKL